MLMLDEINSANQQSGPNQEKQSEGNLAGNHNGSEAALGSTGGGGATFVFEAGVDVGARRVERRGDGA